MYAGAALSASDCSSSSSDGTGVDASGVDATSDTSSPDESGDDAASASADATADVTGPDAATDSAADAASDSAQDAGTDAPSSMSDASDAATAGSLPALPDGGVDQACLAFTCELGNLNCRAAYSSAFTPSAALALYACAQTVCSSDSGAGTFVAGTSCAAAALELTSPQPSVTAFCAPLGSCSDAGTSLSVGQCESYFSAVTPGALGTFQANQLHDSRLGCTDVGSLTFELLSALAVP